MRKGQIALLLLFTVVVIVLFTLLNVDTFMSVRAKFRLENAGDAAAIAAAHRQGELLNEIGALNIDHVVAAANDDTNRCREIVLQQRRLALLGPIEAMSAASAAAMQNGMAPRPEFSQILREHVDEIRMVYNGGSGSGDPYPEPFEGAWAAYALAIETALAGGLAAGPDNVEFHNARGGHLLMNKQFYNAIAAKDWCWFHFNCSGLLDDYTSYHDWGPLPAANPSSLGNSEIFSLHVEAQQLSLVEMLGVDGIAELLDAFDRTKEAPPEKLAKSALLRDRKEPWFMFEEWAWSRWFNGSSLAGDEEGGPFPIAGTIKEEYNVRGCAAVVRCVKGVSATAVDLVSDFSWTAAAKPFGEWNGEGSLFMVPGFTDVRLVPVDAVAGANLDTADYSWVMHVRKHLPVYLEKGPRALGDCHWCSQLKTWEIPSFRREGSTWLKYNSGTCRRGGGGGGGHGGASHGH